MRHPFFLLRGTELVAKDVGRRARPMGLLPPKRTEGRERLMLSQSPTKPKHHLLAKQQTKHPLRTRFFANFL